MKYNYNDFLLNVGSISDCDAFCFVVIVVDVCLFLFVFTPPSASVRLIFQTNPSWGGSNSLLKGACHQSKVNRQTIDFILSP